LSFHPDIRRRRRGVSLVEFVVAAAIGILVMSSTISLLIYSGRMYYAATMQTRFNNMANGPLERLKNLVRGASQVAVTNNGDRLEVTNPDNSVSAFYFNDGDNTSGTLQNNRMLFTATGNAAPQQVANYIDRSWGQPIFTRVAGSVVINFRMGRPRTSGLPYIHGIGVRSVDVFTTVTMRNIVS
jgi:hypothetical protein